MLRIAVKIFVQKYCILLLTYAIRLRIIQMCNRITYIIQRIAYVVKDNPGGRRSRITEDTDMERIILHVDINNCFASIEAALNPSLKGRAIAVCGSEKERHGIVLAKSEAAKRFGVCTGDTVWQARQKCPGLVTVQPHYEQYLRYSAMARRIYDSYTDRVEPFGLDECWLDVTGSTKLFGSGEKIAHDIRERVKRELGVTVSVGVSFSKLFAKVGSDMKKPDAVTVIDREHYMDIVGDLSADAVMGVGRSTSEILHRHGIYTVRDIAQAGQDNMRRFLGKNGLDLWRQISGTDGLPVACSYSVNVPKSVSSGVTTGEDMFNRDEICRVMLSLSGEVSARLRDEQMCACGVQIGVRTSESLKWHQYQMPLAYPVQSVSGLYGAACRLIGQYDWASPVRSVSVRAVNLCPAGSALQQNMLGGLEQYEKRERADEAAYKICKRYGRGAVASAGLLFKTKMPSGIKVNSLPGAEKNACKPEGS